MKADLEAAVRATLIHLVIALDPNLAFRISAAGMRDGPGAIADDLSAFGAGRREPGLSDPIFPVSVPPDLSKLGDPDSGTASSDH